MPVKNMRTLELEDRQAWRKWLSRNHESESVIWLVFRKRHTGVQGMSDNDAVLLLAAGRKLGLK